MGHKSKAVGSNPVCSFFPHLPIYLIQRFYLLQTLEPGLGHFCKALI